MDMDRVFCRGDGRLTVFLPRSLVQWALHMRRLKGWLAGLLFLLLAGAALADPRVIDIPTREGVTERVLWLPAQTQPVGILMVMPGGHGGLRISDAGSIAWGENIFLVRNREALSRMGLHVLIVDAPSDRGAPNYLRGFRQTADHVSDLRAIIQWARKEAPGLPLWLAGFSRGTQSAAYAGLRLSGSADAPDAVVLVSSIVVDKPGGRPVSAMPLEHMRVPVLVIHHRRDSCEFCPFDRAQSMMNDFSNAPARQLLAYDGGRDHRDSCGPLGYHGYAGIEDTVASEMVAWLRQNAGAPAAQR